MKLAARSARPLVVAGSFGALLTLLVTVLPFVRFAYFAPSLHVAIETASGLAALLAAYLVYGRFRHSARLPELGLMVAFVLFGFTNLVLFALPTAVAGTRPETAVLWVGILARLLAAVVFAAAAVAPAVRLPDPPAAARSAVAVSVSAVALICGGVALFGRDLPVGIDPTLALDEVRFMGPPVIHAFQLLAVGLFTAAAVGFSRRAVSTGDDLLTWFATGSVLAAFAHVNYLLFPSRYSNWIYTGDILRLGFYAVVLFAAAREIRRYWQRIAEAEVVEERRRLARELHDGVAQELAFIARRTRLGADGLDPPTVGQIAAAADRARSEARRAVAALSGRGDEPFAVALEQAVEHIAARTGVQVRLDVSARASPPPDVAEHLIRIACEAVSNAVRHSDATAVVVEFSDGDGVRLSVVDDGVGFDTTKVNAHGNGGFGLLIMRERAERLGAVLGLTSRPGAGTEVVVMLP
jgi:signal transduction histidine kinase